MSADTDTYTLDARGLACPMPVLRTNRMLKTLPAGARLAVLTTDPAAPADLKAYCEQTGHRLVRQNNDETVIEKVEG